MSNSKKTLICLLQDLCDLYKNYIDRNKNSKLYVIIKNNSIGIKLFNRNVEVDFFEISFSKKEKKLHLYVSFAIMKLLFKNNIIYNKKDMFYNEKIPYLLVIIDDKNILNKIINMIFSDNKLNINEKMCGLNRKKYIKKMEDRVYISRKLLGIGDVK